MTAVNYGDGLTQGYTFDPMGNRLAKTDNVNGNDSYTHNAANMLLTRNNNGYTNDANGNTLTGGGRTNTWDGQNRLTQCVYNGTTTSHVYGSDGLRRRTTEGSTVTDYLLDGQSVVRTLTNGTVDKTYLHGVRGPEYERTGNNSPVWYVYDGLGSVLATIDQNVNLVSTRKYDVYGGVRSSTGPSGPKHKFVGSLGHPSEDETGLVYMRARYADPVTGSFVGEDAEKTGKNWFTYCRANPTNRVDFDGNVDWEMFKLGMAMTQMGIGFLHAGRAQLGLAAIENIKSSGKACTSVLEFTHSRANVVRPGLQATSTIQAGLYFISLRTMIMVMIPLNDGMPSTDPARGPSIMELIDKIPK